MMIKDTFHKLFEAHPTRRRSQCAGSRLDGSPVILVRPGRVRGGGGAGPIEWQRAADWAREAKKQEDSKVCPTFAELDLPPTFAVRQLRFRFFQRINIVFCLLRRSAPSLPRSNIPITVFVVQKLNPRAA